MLNRLVVRFLAAVQWLPLGDTGNRFFNSSRHLKSYYWVNSQFSCTHTEGGKAKRCKACLALKENMPGIPRSIVDTI